MIGQATADAPAVARPSAGGVRAAFGVGFLLCVMVVGTVSWPRPLPFSDLAQLRIDLSGILVVDRMFVQGGAFGVDAIHPYGPLSFLRTAFYYPGTFGFFLFGRVLLATTQAVAWWHVLRRLGCTNSLVLLAVGAGMVWLSIVDSDPLFSITLVLLNATYFVADRERTSAATLLTAVVAAMLALVKFQFAVLLVVQLAVITVADVFVRRRAPVVLLATAIAFAGWWMAAGQTFANVLPWFARTYRVSGNFDDTNTLGYLDPMRLGQVLIFLASSGVFLLIHATLLAKLFRRRIEVFLSLAAMAVYLFVNYKYGVVRHDGHAAHAALAFVAVAGVYLVLLVARTPRNGRWFLAVVAVVAAIGLNLMVMRQWDIGPPSPAAVVAKVETALARLATVGVADEGFRAQFRDQEHRVRSLLPFRSLTGSVDVVHDNPALAILAGLDYRPRPSFLSQQATSVEALRLNAEFYRSAAAPGHVVVDANVVDGRLATSDDSLLWPELLSRYDVASRQGELLLLRRREQPRIVRRTPFLETTVNWRTPIAIDNRDGRVVWAEIGAERNWLGRLVTLAFKAPELLIIIEGTDRRETAHRLLPAAGRVGFIVSPRVESIQDVAGLYGQTDASITDLQVARTVRLELNPAWFRLYRDRITVRLSWLDLAPAMPRAPADPDEAKRTRNLRVLNENAGPDFKLPWAGFRTEPDSGNIVLYAHAPRTVRRPISPNDSRLALGFGMMPSSYTGGAGGDGTVFLVYGLRRDGGRDVLFRRHLSPVASPADRGTHTAHVSFRRGAFEALLFETHPGPNDWNSWDHAYWSRADVD